MIKCFPNAVRIFLKLPMHHAVFLKKEFIISSKSGLSCNKYSELMTFFLNNILSTYSIIASMN